MRDSVPISIGGQPARNVRDGVADGTSRERSAADALAGDHPPVRSLYIHIPFCAHKCHYCDFYSFVDEHDRQGPFVDRLIDELRALSPHARGEPLRTIFIGGGTPSLLRVELWEELFGAIDEQFDLSFIRRAGASATNVARADSVVPTTNATDEIGWPVSEFTVECNPESATPELLRVLRAGGVDRVSMGAQSFHERHLRTLERWHTPGAVEAALAAARDAGITRTSIDLIYAVPGQTLDEWERDLTRAIALGTTHVSCYNLTYEPHTLMTNRLKRGEFVPTDEDLETRMFERTGELLGAAGFERYEVSNYARPGQASRHNLAYWLQEQWLAAGPSASGHVWASRDRLAGGHRFKNVGNFTAYLASTGPSPLSDHEPPDAIRGVRERVMTGVRLAVGVDEPAVIRDAEAVAPGSASRWSREADGLIGDGLLERVAMNGAPRLRVTKFGWLMADFVAKRLMATIG